MERIETMPNYRERRVTITTTGGLIVPPSPIRLSIVFPAGLVNRYTVSNGPTPVIDEGMTLYPGNDAIVLYRGVYGDAVTKSWVGISAVADQVVVIGEVYE